MCTQRRCNSQQKTSLSNKKNLRNIHLRQLREIIDDSIVEYFFKADE